MRRGTQNLDINKNDNYEYKFNLNNEEHVIPYKIKLNSNSTSEINQNQNQNPNVKNAEQSNSNNNKNDGSNQNLSRFKINNNNNNINVVNDSKELNISNNEYDSEKIHLIRINKTCIKVKDLKQIISDKHDILINKINIKNNGISLKAEKSIISLLSEIKKFIVIEVNDVQNIEENIEIKNTNDDVLVNEVETMRKNVEKKENTNQKKISMTQEYYEMKRKENKEIVITIYKSIPNFPKLSSLRFQFNINTTIKSLKEYLHNSRGYDDPKYLIMIIDKKIMEDEKTLGDYFEVNSAENLEDLVNLENKYDPEGDPIECISSKSYIQADKKNKDKKNIGFDEIDDKYDSTSTEDQNDENINKTSQNKNKNSSLNIKEESTNGTKIKPRINFIKKPLNLNINNSNTQKGNNFSDNFINYKDSNELKNRIVNNDNNARGSFKDLDSRYYNNFENAEYKLSNDFKHHNNNHTNHNQNLYYDKNSKLIGFKRKINNQESINIKRNNYDVDKYDKYNKNDKNKVKKERNYKSKNANNEIIYKEKSENISKPYSAFDNAFPSNANGVFNITNHNSNSLNSKNNQYYNSNYNRGNFNKSDINYKTVKNVKIHNFKNLKEYNPPSYSNDYNSNARFFPDQRIKKISNRQFKNELYGKVLEEYNIASKLIDDEEMFIRRKLINFDSQYILDNAYNISTANYENLLRNVDYKKLYLDDNYIPKLMTNEFDYLIHYKNNLKTKENIKIQIKKDELLKDNRMIKDDFINEIFYSENQFKTNEERLLNNEQPLTPPAFRDKHINLVTKYIFSKDLNDLYNNKECIETIEKSLENIDNAYNNYFNHFYYPNDDHTEWTEEYYATNILTLIDNAEDLGILFNQKNNTFFTIDEYDLIRINELKEELIRTKWGEQAPKNFSIIDLLGDSYDLIFKNSLLEKIKTLKENFYDNESENDNCEENNYLDLNEIKKVGLLQLKDYNSIFELIDKEIQEEIDLKLRQEKEQEEKIKFKILEKEKNSDNNEKNEKLVLLNINKDDDVDALTKDCKFNYKMANEINEEKTEQVNPISIENEVNMEIDKLKANLDTSISLDKSNLHKYENKKMNEEVFVKVGDIKKENKKINLSSLGFNRNNNIKTELLLKTTDGKIKKMSKIEEKKGKLVIPESKIVDKNILQLQELFENDDEIELFEEKLFILFDKATSELNGNNISHIKLFNKALLALPLKNTSPIDIVLDIDYTLLEAHIYDVFPLSNDINMEEVLEEQIKEFYKKTDFSDIHRNLSYTYPITVTQKNYMTNKKTITYLEVFFRKELILTLLNLKNYFGKVMISTAGVHQYAIKIQELLENYLFNNEIKIDEIVASDKNNKNKSTIKKLSFFNYYMNNPEAIDNCIIIDDSPHVWIEDIKFVIPSLKFIKLYYFETKPGVRNEELKNTKIDDLNIKRFLKHPLEYGKVDDRHNNLSNYFSGITMNDEKEFKVVCEPEISEVINKNLENEIGEQLNNVYNMLNTKQMQKSSIEDIKVKKYMTYIDYKLEFANFRSNYFIPIVETESTPYKQFHYVDETIIKIIKIKQYLQSTSTSFILDYLRKTLFKGMYFNIDYISNTAKEFTRKIIENFGGKIVYNTDSKAMFYLFDNYNYSGAKANLEQKLKELNRNKSHAFNYESSNKKNQVSNIPSKVGLMNYLNKEQKKVQTMNLLNKGKLFDDDYTGVTSENLSVDEKKETIKKIMLNDKEDFEEFLTDEINDDIENKKSAFLVNMRWLLRCIWNFSILNFEDECFCNNERY